MPSVIVMIVFHIASAKPRKVALLGGLNTNHGELPADLFRDKPDLVTWLDLVEQRGILYSIHHGHRRRHIEFWKWAVADCQLLAVLVHLAHFTVGRVCRRLVTRSTRGDGTNRENGSNHHVCYFHR